MAGATTNDMSTCKCSTGFYHSTNHTMLRRYFPSTGSSVRMLCKANHPYTIILFFGSYTETVETIKKPVSHAECRDMIYSKRTPTGGEMQRLRDRFFGTKLEPNAAWSWPTTTVDTVTNYYFIHMTIAFSNSDTSIQSTTKLLDNCHYHQEKCPTELGMLIWNAADVNVCRLKKGITNVCTHQ